MDFHFNHSNTTLQFDEKKAFYIFNELENLVDIEYSKMIHIIKKNWDAFENKQLIMQPYIENVALDIYKKDKQKAREFLTDYCSQNSYIAILEAKRLINYIKEVIFSF